VKEAFRKSRARIVYVVNIMTKFGETHNFSGWDFIVHLERFLGRPVDVVLYNATRPPAEVIEQYRAQKAEFVEIDRGEPCWGDRRIYAADLLDASGGVVRHDSRKLARLIEQVAGELCRRPLPA
jgi:uncharacterized cofD-like protein